MIICTMNKIFSIIGFTLLILLLSGCINNSEINEFALDQINNGGQGGIDPIDNINDIIPPVIPHKKDSEELKFTPPYVCEEDVVQEALDPLFGSEIKVSRILKFGGPINLAKCNIVVDNIPILQFEFVKHERFDKALNYMQDQERQYVTQLDFAKQKESITENASSFVSLKTGESRIIFIDSDPTEPVVVKIKSFPGDTANVDTLRKVGVALEKILK